MPTIRSELRVVVIGTKNVIRDIQGISPSHCQFADAWKTLQDLRPPEVATFLYHMKQGQKKVRSEDCVGLGTMEVENPHESGSWPAQRDWWVH